MGLQVWLPLQGNLENKGLSKVTLTISGTPTIEDGKIGQCYTFNENSYLLSTESFLEGATKYSLCCWFKSDYEGTSWKRIIALGNHTRAHLDISPTTQKVRFFISKDGTSSVYSSVNSTTLCHDGQWHHVCGTFDNGKIKLYIDGILEGSATGDATTYTATGGQQLAIGAVTNGGGIFKGSINDVRIYDECLSPMQVKLISQGLVAHYLLNNNGSGQENLLRNSYRADGNDAQQKYGWEKNGGETPEIVEKDGFQCIHLQTSCTEKKIPSIKSANKILLENGMEYTISCDLMIDKEIKVESNTPIHYHNGSSSTINEFNFSNVNNGKGFTFKSISPVANTIIPANTWQHYEQHIVTVATPSDSSLPYSTYRAFIHGSVRTVSETATVNMWLKNWKIEKGAISTSWCPNSLDDMSINLGYNNNIEYDVSGYCHNGTKYNITDYTSDTPRYSVATKFNGTNSYINVGRGGMVRDEITINIWAYMEDWTTYNYRLISCTESGGWNFEKSGDGIHFAIGTGATSNTYKNTTNYPLANLTSGWHMFTGSYDGFQNKMYIDGVLAAQNNSPYTTKTPIYYNSSAPVLIGAEANTTQNPAGYYFNGYMSDIRIYATALSESDLQSLYNNSGFLDSSGNIYATEYTES